MKQSIKIGALLLLFISAGIFQPIFSQEKKKIEIIYADYLEQNPKIAANTRRLVGNVQVSHNNAIMLCDSAYIYQKSNKMDAFGNVHINQGDTVHLYAHKIFYDGNTSFARSTGNVRLIKKDMTLYTDTLDYNMDTNVAYYEDRGKIIDSTNVLTSEIGYYFSDIDMVHFYKDVDVVNPDFTLQSDTLKYNTTNGIIYIEGPTTIQDSINNLYAEDGWYDSKTGYAELLKNPTMANDKQNLKSNIIKYFREDGRGFAYGDVEVQDIENQLIVKGENAVYNKNLEMATISDSALLILYSEEDTLYLHADTLMTYPDTVEDEKIIRAYWGVRFYRNDIQGICDSLVYFSKDSLVQLFTSPYLWSGIRQMSAEYIEMKSYTNSPDEVTLQNSSFIISKRDSIMFDQIKGKKMIGYIKDNTLSRIDVDGNGQTLYYAQDKNDIVGLNKAESSKMSILFKDGKAYKIKFISMPEGVLNPLDQITGEDRKLNGFSWKEELRPKDKNDVMRDKTKNLSVD